MSMNYDGDAGETRAPFTQLNDAGDGHIRPLDGESQPGDYSFMGDVRLGGVVYSATEDGITVTVDAPADFDQYDFNDFVETVYGEETEDGQQAYHIGPEETGFDVAFRDYGSETAVHLQFDDPVTDEVEQRAMDAAEDINRYLNGDSDAYLT